MTSFSKSYKETQKAVKGQLEDSKFYLRLRSHLMEAKMNRINRMKVSDKVYRSKLLVIKKHLRSFLATMKKIVLLRPAHLTKSQKRQHPCWQRKPWVISSLRVRFRSKTQSSSQYRPVTWMCSTTFTICWRTRSVSSLLTKEAQTKMTPSTKHAKQSSLLAWRLVCPKSLWEASRDNLLCRLNSRLLVECSQKRLLFLQ
jgi:hypothetical protein